ncbi:MAG: DUF3179 domain-containing protein [Gaiellaceae bacterium MAG52_C11]|nr:DUF3179 domain-containing protein [Candidatus Gaiellasilicea maunaloa]
MRLRLSLRVASLLVALASVLAGCGGDGGGEAEQIRSLEELAATIPDPGPGLGEVGAPPSLTAGWKTDFSKHSVALAEFRSGGPGRDGIPAIDRPELLPVADVVFLKPQEPVILLELGGESRAYPLQILIWHEIVNDELGGVPVAVTFCPLCNTALVFDRRVRGRTLDFGTTGNLRHSDLVMYDRQTESWWQQFSGEALVGELTGTKLRRVPARIVAWREFQADHPDGRVLSRETGHDRSYGENPYVGYDDVDSPPYFSTPNEDDDRLQPKERVVYLERGAEAVAIPFTTLQARRVVEVEVSGQRLTVTWRAGVASALNTQSIGDGRDVGSASVTLGGRPVPFDQPFWFAVAAFRPDVRVVR